MERSLGAVSIREEEVDVIQDVIQKTFRMVSQRR